MLHDLGNIAISDSILRRGKDLSDEERSRVHLHPIYGARLPRRDDSPWDVMARGIALNHHERWDGTGYPGHIDDVFARELRVGRPKGGTEIPLSARVVAIADVYDALMSPCAHRYAWPEERVIDYLASGRGTRFDPNLSDSSHGMLDVLGSIGRKWSY